MASKSRTDSETAKALLVRSPKGGTLDGFRRMLRVARQHSADHIPVSALQPSGAGVVIRSGFFLCKA